MYNCTACVAGWIFKGYGSCTLRHVRGCGCGYFEPNTSLYRTYIWIWGSMGVSMAYMVASFDMLVSVPTGGLYS